MPPMSQAMDSWIFCPVFLNVSRDYIHSNWQVQFSSVAQSCPTLRPHESQHARPPCPSPTPEFTQIHVHWVSDAIQPSHPRSSPSPPAPNPSQHQSLSSESTLRMRWPKDWSFGFAQLQFLDWRNSLLFVCDDDLYVIPWNWVFRFPGLSFFLGRSFLKLCI